MDKNGQANRPKMIPIYKVMFSRLHIKVYNFVPTLMRVKFQTDISSHWVYGMTFEVWCAESPNLVLSCQSCAFYGFPAGLWGIWVIVLVCAKISHSTLQIARLVGAKILPLFLVNCSFLKKKYCRFFFLSICWRHWWCVKHTSFCYQLQNIQFSHSFN